MKNSCALQSTAGTAMPWRIRFHHGAFFLALCMPAPGMGQIDVPIPLPAAGRQKAAVEKETTGAVPNYPQLVDITASTGIDFKHLSSPEAKFIVESMSGGVALIDPEARLR
jgi:hypothetical protein